MKQFLALTFYNFLLLIVALVDVVKWLLFLVKASFKGLLGQAISNHEKREVRWGQKYGLLPWRLPADLATQNSILVHCASVGEIVAIFPLIQVFLKKNPGFNVVVTTNTKTGKEQLLRLIQQHELSNIHHLYLPIDLPWLMAKLIRRIKPKALLIMEVELWPNLLKQCRRFNVPTFVINARLTDKTARGYRKFSWITLPMLQGLTQVFVRNDIDEANYLSFGLNPNRVELLGNIKFDLELPDGKLAKTLREEMGLKERNVFLAGSTHFGEEELVVKMYQRFKQKHKDLALIIAPRHPHRFGEVLEYLLVQDLKVNQQSKGEVFAPHTDVLLVDSMGILSTLYGVSDFCFVGGSVADRGGHNPIEPASYGKPILMGPNIQNNPEICGLLSERGGLVICHSEAEFEQQMSEWLTKKRVRNQAGKAGKETILAHDGLIEDIVTRINTAIQ